MIEDKPRVLVVDDERFYLDLLVDLLKSDYTVIVARDGPTALKRAFNWFRPDLILLDVADDVKVIADELADPAIA